MIELVWDSEIFYYSSTYSNRLKNELSNKVDLSFFNKYVENKI